MNRILSNPPNEIMSKGLEEIFSPKEDNHFSINFEDREIFIDLDSFCLENNLVKRLSFKINSETALKIMKVESYKISSKDAILEIESAKIQSLNCFYYDSDSYILEIEVNND